MIIWSGSSQTDLVHCLLWEVINVDEVGLVLLHLLHLFYPPYLLTVKVPVPSPTPVLAHCEGPVPSTTPVLPHCAQCSPSLVVSSLPARPTSLLGAGLWSDLSCLSVSDWWQAGHTRHFNKQTNNTRRSLNVTDERDVNEDAPIDTCLM